MKDQFESQIVSSISRAILFSLVSNLLGIGFNNLDNSHKQVSLKNVANSM